MIVEQFLLLALIAGNCTVVSFLEGAAAMMMGVVERGVGDVGQVFGLLVISGYV